MVKAGPRRSMTQCKVGGCRRIVKDNAAHLNDRDAVPAEVPETAQGFKPEQERKDGGSNLTCVHAKPVTTAHAVSVRHRTMSSK
eukprot:6173632-Pleurochrysis_carterae.AAC.11